MPSPLASDTMLVVPTAADNIQKADNVKQKPKKIRRQVVRLFGLGRSDTSKGSRIRSSQDLTRSAVCLENTISSCNSERPPLEPASNGCMKVRMQAESIFLVYGSSSSSSSSTQSNDSETRATFTTVTFHTHAIVLGDNPSVSVGPPLAMGWEAAYSETVNLDEYEKSRPPRREKCDMLLPKCIRMSWLQEEGYARSELKDAEDAIKVIKRYRRANAHKGIWEKVRVSVRTALEGKVQSGDDGTARRRRSSRDVIARAPQAKRALAA
jgi:hypothetical protein